jgi:hypothetical protein
VGFTASCTATSPSPWVGNQLLAEGQSASGTVTFQTTPGAGEVSSITTSYDLNVTQPGATPINQDVTWSNPRQIRCDTTFASNTRTGCVISDLRPHFTLSLSEYGAAAAAYGLAEQDWSDHWGADDSPLQRLADPDAQVTNRTNTCGANATRQFDSDDGVAVSPDRLSGVPSRQPEFRQAAQCTSPPPARSRSESRVGCDTVIGLP